MNNVYCKDQEKTEKLGHLLGTLLSEFVGNNGITLIEWGELFQEELPQEYLSVKIVKEETGRRIFFEAYGSHYKELCEKVWKFVNAGN